MNDSNEDVKAGILRVIELLEPGIVISPSHEVLLPNIPPENIAAMAVVLKT